MRIDSAKQFHISLPSRKHMRQQQFVQPDVKGIPTELSKSQQRERKRPHTIEMVINMSPFINSCVVKSTVEKDTHRFRYIHRPTFSADFDRSVWIGAFDGDDAETRLLGRHVELGGQNGAHDLPALV